jgi:hypothetical protein
LHLLLPSTFLDFCWLLVDELGFIGDANSSCSLIVQRCGGELFFFVYKRYASHLYCQGNNLIGTCIEPSSSTTLGCCLMTMVVALWDTVDRPPLIFDVWWYEDACHDVVSLVILVLVVNVRVGLFEDDESRHQIS